MPASRWLGARNAEWLEMTGRLRKGVSIEGAQANISQLTGNYAAAYPDFNRREGESERNRGGIQLVPVGSLRVRNEWRSLAFSDCCSPSLVSCC